MLAYYFQQAGGEGRLRLDFFDQVTGLEEDIYLALDMLPGGTQSLPIGAHAQIDWDLLVVVPANGEIYALDAKFNRVSLPPVWVSRDPQQDTFSLAWQGSLLKSDPAEARLKGVEIFTTAAGETALADQLGPVDAWGPPPQPADALLVYWDTYPAYTPALALRRWDGAHTGPLGGRHGLVNLLRTAANREVPLALLDLKAPASLSALDYSGGLRQVQRWAAQGNLILPESLPGFYPVAASSPAGLYPTSPAALSLAAEASNLHDQDFKLAPSQFIFAPQLGGLAEAFLPAATAGIFTFADEPAQPDFPTFKPTYWRGKLVLALPWELSALGFDEQGPMQATKAALIRNALLQNQSGSGNGEILALGGSLPASPLGNPQVARATFEYIDNHPWIHLVDSNDLLALAPNRNSDKPLSAALSAGSSELTGSPPWLAQLTNAAPNKLGAAAWQAYQALYNPAPPNPGELPALRQAYQGIVPDLQAAAQWAQHPNSITDCTQDIDMDGKQDCLLANEHLWALLSPADGSLTLLAAVTAGEAHEAVGPSYQLISGLSDPAGWDLTDGIWADPTVLTGAFSDQSPSSGQSPMQSYSIAVAPGQVLFRAADGTSQKGYRLSGETLQVSLLAPEGTSYTIPVVLDPWQRFEPGWPESYLTEAAPKGTRWQTPGVSFEIQTDAPFSANDFNESRDSLTPPEDPNKDYPPGFFLPLPMGVMELRITGNTTVTLQVISKNK
jgi:hypothetical protein